jgi:hypothetical protein
MNLSLRLFTPPLSLIMLKVGGDHLADCAECAEAGPLYGMVLPI